MAKSGYTHKLGKQVIAACQRVLEKPLYGGKSFLRQILGALVLIILIGFTTTGVFAVQSNEININDPTPVHFGQSGENVVLLQKALAQLDVYKGKITGVFDSATQTAVKIFQQHVFIPTNGQADTLTWRSLREAVNRYPLVIGYYGNGGVYDSYPVLKERSQFITAIAPVWFWVENDGRVLGKVDPATIELARQRGVRLLALVSNLKYDTATSKDQVNRILGNIELGKTVIRNIIIIVERYGFTGINLDFEYIRPEDRDKFSAFVALLGKELHAKNRWFTISVAAKTADRDFSYGFNGGFDYQALGKSADHLILMAYDYHYAGGPPGPVAPLDWVQRVISYAKTRVHGSQVILGINAYGYDWRDEDTRGRAIVMRNVSEWAAARGATLLWDPIARVPYARYEKDGEAWLENATSIGRKMDLVGQYDIAGLAWWRMGYEDSTFWDTLEARWPYPVGFGLS